MEKWVETRKECDIDVDGTPKIKKVTLELRKKRILGLETKDVLELVFKFIGLIAIATPVVLFYLQQAALIRNQKAALEADAFLNTSLELHKLLKNPLTDKLYILEEEKLLYEYYPRFALLEDSVTLDTVEVIIDHLHNQHVFSKFIAQRHMLDSLINSDIYEVLANNRIMTPIDLKFDTVKLTTIKKTISKLSDTAFRYSERIYLQMPFESLRIPSKTQLGFIADTLISSLLTIDQQYSEICQSSLQLIDNIKYYKYRVRKNKTSINSNYSIDDNNDLQRSYMDLKDSLRDIDYLLERYKFQIDHLIGNLDRRFIRANQLFKSQ